MKNLLVVFGIFVTTFLSCNSAVNYDQMIKEQIANFYTTTDVKEYKPISYGEFDTIQRINDLHGSSVKIIGIVTHGYEGLDDNGIITRYEDTFDVTIYKDVVVVIPRGY